MALAPRLDLRTSQTLVLSPQLQTAIRLLTLSNLELMTEISAELDRNPLLELASDNADARNPSGDTQGRDSDTSPDTQAAPTEAASLQDELQSAPDPGHTPDQDVDYMAERFHHDSPADSGPASVSDLDFSFDRFAAPEQSLAEVLEQQALGLPADDLVIARHLIAHIDEAGYLTESTASLAARLQLDEAEIERVLLIIQTFEPTGVGARSLAECIALQAKEADRYDPCMERLIDNLDLVARGEVAQLQRICHVDAEDLRDMLHELRHYDPKPGLVHGGSGAIPIVPDLYVRRKNGGWAIELNAATLPQLIVNRQYEAEIIARNPQDPDAGKTERRFINQCLSQAHWLIKALDQRAQTILKVATAIIERQQDFLIHGPSRLVPLTLREIAAETELHESTVSRVTSNKYLSCDRGLFELKYFFTTAIAASNGGEDVSAEAARQKLKQLIDDEDPLKPLSDSRLTELMREEGYDLARRTIAKYREAMNIAASFDRRRRALLERA